MAVVHQVVREREAGRPQAHHEHLAASRWLRQRPLQIERIPAREQRIDFKPPGQRQHVLENSRLDLRNVDRLLLLVDAGFHAVVADAVPGRGAHRIVDDGNGKRADRVSLRLGQVHLGDFFLERASRERHAERALLELAGLLPKPLRATVLALVVAPDAVVGVVEGAFEAGAGVRQGKAVACAAMVLRELDGGDRSTTFRLDRNEVLRVDLRRNLEQHALGVASLPLRRMHRPGGVAGGKVERLGALRLGLHPGIDMLRETQFGEFAADERRERGTQGCPVEGRGLGGTVFPGRAPLHEQALDRVERRQFFMTRPQIGDLAGDPEQRGDEIFEFRRKLNDELGFRLARNALRHCAGCLQACGGVRVARGQEFEEPAVDLCQSVAAIEIVEMQAEAEMKTLRHQQCKSLAARARIGSWPAGAQPWHIRLTPRTYSK